MVYFLSVPGPRNCSNPHRNSQGGHVEIPKTSFSNKIYFIFINKYAICLFISMESSYILDLKNVSCFDNTLRELILSFSTEVKIEHGRDDQQRPFENCLCFSTCQCKFLSKQWTYIPISLLLNIQKPVRDLTKAMWGCCEPLSGIDFVPRSFSSYIII